MTATIEKMTVVASDATSLETVERAGSNRSKDAQLSA